MKKTILLMSLMTQIYSFSIDKLCFDFWTYPTARNMINKLYTKMDETLAKDLEKISENLQDALVKAEEDNSMIYKNLIAIEKQRAIELTHREFLKRKSIELQNLLNNTNSIFTD